MEITQSENKASFCAGSHMILKCFAQAPLYSAALAINYDASPL